uniref:MBD domain-containing protein n=1 Tax=Glossina brevipalpis TaxID=37001 RepID=A0A1A9WZD5_9MUSC
MEVDDTIAMNSPGDDVEDHEEQSIMKALEKNNTDGEMEQSAEEPPDEDELENASNITNTPFKLEVSGSEIEDDEEVENVKTMAGKGVRRKLVAAPLPEVKLEQIKEELEELEEVARKRKRYEVRNSDSEDCLLGFDEQNGEAESIKLQLAEKSLVELEEEHMKIPHDVCTSPIRSPKFTKIVEEKPNEEEASTLQKSPKNHEKSGNVDPIATSTEDKSISKTHIVADAEECRKAVITNNNSLAVNTTTASKVINTTSASTPAGSTAKKVLSPQDSYYKKPFEYGWKRELVWRANLEASKDKADVYFISPAGKKLRARSDIAPLLEGDLTIDHFCFVREPLGAGPELETVRSAKPSSRASVTAATLAAAPSPPNIGKRISKPKGPKGASPPPQGWTPSKALKVNNAALLSSSNIARHSSSSYHHHHYQGTPPSNKRQDQHHQHSHVPSSSGSSSHSSKSIKLKKTVATTANKQQQTEYTDNSAINTPASSSNNSNIKYTNSTKVREPCSVNCLKARGQVPLLQCIKCLCHYHHQCMGLTPHNSDYRTVYNLQGKDYICENCYAVSTSGIKVVTKKASLASSAMGHPDNKLPQTIAVVKGKKYVMVAKPLHLPNEHVNDIENDLKQINDSIRKNRKHSLETSFPIQNANTAANNAVAVDYSNKLFASNFFANISFAYDALLSILKYLKIHERPRAAAVCKLWNLAAKDTSLWQTVRMKNSKVCSWSGFAAALRRGETKHLDLRKMLLTSGRSEDMWQDFCENIGTVCSLETIDLCRCSVRVVESLFQSNRNLRVLNALAINDDTINLEHVGLLNKLEELRLRTCEAAVLTGDLLPLGALSTLTHLSITSVRGLGAKSIEILGDLNSLKSLELGECGDFDSSFSEAVLPKLINLQRLRLENGQVTKCCTLKILDAAARLAQLYQLELVNFDIKPGFDEKLSLCTNITKLLIIPTYISQSATTNNIVLSAVQQVSRILKCFTWGVTVELLRVTALYVDQCEESTKKEKHHFDECIPVLKPVPGAIPNSEDEAEEETQKLASKINASNSEGDSGAEGGGTSTSEVPQIEILPLDKVETILADNLPHTKFTIVKVPYHMTCKQHLVE